MEGEAKGAVVGFGGDADGVADDVVDFDVFCKELNQYADALGGNRGSSGWARHGQNTYESFRADCSVYVEMRDLER